MSPASPRRTLDFVIYSSGSIGCNLDGFTISIDWSATVGRWASRYPTTLVSWAIGVVAIIVFTTWGMNDRGGGKLFSSLYSLHLPDLEKLATPTVKQSLTTYSQTTFPKLLFASLLIAALPIPAEYYLGTNGEILFAPIAPILLLIASGLVCISWWILVALMWPIGKLGALIFRRSIPYRIIRKDGRLTLVKT